MKLRDLLKEEKTKPTLDYHNIQFVFSLLKIIINFLHKNYNEIPLSNQKIIVKSIMDNFDNLPSKLQDDINLFLNKR